MTVQQALLVHIQETLLVIETLTLQISEVTASTVLAILGACSSQVLSLISAETRVTHVRFC